ncbi:PQQ-binding-like beta-propeller repeat protein [Thalassoglobus sp. JC818]|uniref:outer membrane protein assembly factor BamB family protein n=1 Tax=Thalassoglobus sp. JC818 TaxID=3232136 RepID=UPI00345753BB
MNHPSLLTHIPFDMVSEIPMNNHRRTNFLVGWCIACCLVFIAPEAQAQFFNPFGNQEQFDPSSDIDDLVLRLPTDHLVQSAFQQGNDLIAEGKVADGLKILQSILDESVDFFTTDDNVVGAPISRLVRSTIETHRDEYERLYGGEAQRLLKLGVAEQDRLAIGEVARRFAATEAGIEALKILKRTRLDVGDLSGAQRTHSTDELNDHIETLKEKIQLGSESESPRQTWTNPHGSPSHAGSFGFSPVRSSQIWNRSLIDEYDFFLGDINREADLVQESLSIANATGSRIHASEKLVSFPAGRALSVGNLVLVPGYTAPKAYDIETGELVGVGIKSDETFDYLFKTTSSPAGQRDPFREEMLSLFFSLRGWRDLTSSSLSTDGEYVYAITDCQLVGSTQPDLLMRSNHRHELLPQSFNQLHCYEIATGLRNRWSIGSMDDQAVIPFDQVVELPRQVFFYGAPLPVNDQLFVIGEERGEVQLFEIDKHNGDILWSIGLLNPNQDLVFADSRRLAGLMPAYLDGLLICPTGEGVLTAIDPLNRSVVWTHQYQKSARASSPDLFLRRRRPRSQNISDSIERLIDDQRWFESKIVTANGLLFFTPPDSDELVAVKLEDGTPGWENPLARGQMISILGVNEDQLIVLSRREILALSTVDGSREWSVAIPLPSGRGVRMGETYAQPLSTGEVAFVDLTTGTMLARSMVSPDTPIGNLTVAGDRLVMQTATEISAFSSEAEIRDSLAELADHSPQRVATLAEITLQQGNWQQGYEAFTSIPLDELPEDSRSVLAWAMIERLAQYDVEFDVDEIKNIEPLFTNAEQLFEFRKHLANRFTRNGQYGEAIDQYLTMINENETRGTTQDADGIVELDSQRWVLSEVFNIFQSASEDDAQLLRQRINEWLTEQSNDSAAILVIRSFPKEVLDVENILQRLESIERTLKRVNELSVIWTRLLRDLPSEEQPRALVELAKNSLVMKEGRNANAYLTTAERLLDGQENAPQAVLKEIENLRTAREWLELFRAVPVWPETAIHTDDVNAVELHHRYQIPQLGPSSIPLEGWSFFLDQMGTYIDVYDNDGVRRARLQTGIRTTRFPLGSRLGRHVMMHGNLALIVLAERFLLVDFQLSTELPRVLLNESLVEVEDDFAEQRVFSDPLNEPIPGFRTFLSYRQEQDEFTGDVGTMTSSFLCFGRGVDLTAIDPLTGRLLWERSDLEPGSEVFNDDEYIITKAPRSQIVRIFRAMDGREIGSQEIPAETIRGPIDRHFGEWGRCWPVLHTTYDSREFQMYDPVLDETVWAVKVPEEFVWTTVNGSDIGILDPDGKFIVLDGQTGEERLQSQTEITNSPKSIEVLIRGTSLILVPGDGPPEFYHFSYASKTTHTLETTVNGKVTCIDQTDGSVLWSREIVDQKLNTLTPSAWPVLFFAAPEGRRMELIVLNRFTGREVFNDTFISDAYLVRWKASTLPLLIQIGVGRNTVGIACEEIVAPAVPQQSEDPPAQNE